MRKSVKTCQTKKRPRPRTISPHTHYLVRFIWDEILSRELELQSVADAVGFDRSNFYKWCKATKGPHIMQLEEVLEVLGYELQVVRKVNFDD